MSTGEIEVIYGKWFRKDSIWHWDVDFNYWRIIRMWLCIQFLKGSQKEGELDIIKRLEPEMKVFRLRDPAAILRSCRKKRNMRNRSISATDWTYARKVLADRRVRDADSGWGCLGL